MCVFSLQPCMHCYCGGCYSEWMDSSNKCPAVSLPIDSCERYCVSVCVCVCVKCRRKVERVNKNHLVNNLVDAFLRANPGIYLHMFLCVVYMYNYAPTSFC